MARTRLLLLIEDEPFAADWVKRIVAENFGERCRIVHICSEREFLVRKRDLENMEFSGIILDVILPWEDGVPMGSGSAFPDQRGPVYEAGIRVFEDIKNSSVLKNVPLVIYTVTDEDRLVWPEGLSKPTIMSKQSPDFKLVQWMGQVFQFRSV